MPDVDQRDAYSLGGTGSSDFQDDHQRQTSRVRLEEDASSSARLLLSLSHVAKAGRGLPSPAVCNVHREDPRARARRSIFGVCVCNHCATA